MFLSCPSEFIKINLVGDLSTGSIEFLVFGDFNKLTYCREVELFAFLKVELYYSFSIVYLALQFDDNLSIHHCLSAVQRITYVQDTQLFSIFTPSALTHIRSGV